MSNEERDVILQMLAESKITAAEAATLLDALKESEAGEPAEAGASWQRSAGEHRRAFADMDRDFKRMDREMRRRERDMEREHRRPTNSGRSLFINVTDGDDTRTHVQIPLGMAVAAGKFMPRKARAYFEEYGIDLTELVDSVMNDISRAGEIVNIRDGNKRVQVSP